MKKPKAAKPIESSKTEIMQDDRIGADEPLDEANSQETLEPNPGHRAAKLEEDDEHNAEILTQEGMQGFMHDSLTKPRKTRRD